MKTTKPITWILDPIWLPCTICKTEQSVNEVVIDGVYHFVMCESCSKLSEKNIRLKLNLRLT